MSDVQAGSWRAAARPIIADVIRRHGRVMNKELRKALRDAYPFGERRHHPYKVWLAEIKEQLHGTLAPKNQGRLLP